MAYCNNNAGCGHSCGRSDNHGGDCDCYESDCKHSNRFIKPPVPSVSPLATFYAVRSNGKYYRTYSRASAAAGWIDKLEDARLWTKQGQAQGKITALSRIAKTHKGPGHAPIPELVEFIVTEIRVVDQTDRVAKACQARVLAARALAQKQRDLLDAQRDLKRATDHLLRLRSS